MSYEIIYSCISNTGKLRSMNQDNFICNGVYMEQGTQNEGRHLSGTVSTVPYALFGVFDGMGGEQCGEVASYIAATESANLKGEGDEVTALDGFCKRANSFICDFVIRKGITSMGTTAAMLSFKDDVITLCNIGDSPVFRFYDRELEKLSTDHVAIAPFGRKAPLTQNLGIPEDEMIIEPFYSRGECYDGDRFLICSDGLTDMVKPEEIIEVLDTEEVDTAVQKLTEMALNNGGRDNITIILLEVKEIKKAKKKLFSFKKK